MRKVFGRRRALLAVAAAALACGGRAATAPAVPGGVLVAVSPASRTVFVKDSVTFSATVSAPADASVTWSVEEGAAGGAVTSAGVYTAPSAPGTFHVVATSSEDGLASGRAEVTVPAISVAVSPASAAVEAGGALTFTAAVANASDGGVSWSVEEEAGGVITAGGAYTAPAAAGTFHVVATARVDGRTAGRAEVRVTAAPLDLAARLAALSSRAIFFGHQSVGFNVLSGLQRLLDANGGAEPVIRQTLDPALMGPGILAEAWLGENYDPAGKVDAFQALLAAGTPTPVGDRVGIALMKFCFVDFYDSAPYWSGGDVPSLFARYQGAVAAVRAAHPGLTVVHLTVPLVQVTPYPYPGNDRREAFSELVRSTYAGREPVFDLARLESTAADGVTRCTDARQVPALCAEWGRAGDDGHLGTAGQDMAAAALLELLAALP